MTRPELVFFLEEKSARIVIEAILARLVEETRPIAVRFVVFDGKQNLEKQSERKIRGYLDPDAHFIILRDQDAEDCRKVKKRLQTICRKAGRPECKVRIACRELESFYLGDLAAVEVGLGAPEEFRVEATRRNTAIRTRSSSHLNSYSQRRRNGFRKSEAHAQSPRI